MRPMSVLEAIELRRHEKVRANIDLPGVPAGMKGKVLQKTGVTWIRYRVLFENGVEVGLLDGRHLVKLNGFIPIDQRVAVEVTESTDAGTDAGDGDGEAVAADNAFGVPTHLLERSKKARERLGA